MFRPAFHRASGCVSGHFPGSRRHFPGSPGARGRRATIALVADIETFPNRHPGRDYTIVHTCPEFTAVCPKTGQPDFGTIRISYVPDRECVELKSLKVYLQAYRDRGIYYEHVTNVILDDLVAAVRPRSMTVEGDFHVRGGISTVVRAEYAGRPRRPSRAARGRARAGRR